MAWTFTFDGFTATVELSQNVAAKWGFTGRVEDGSGEVLKVESRYVYESESDAKANARKSAELEVRRRAEEKSRGTS